MPCTPAQGQRRYETTYGRPVLQGTQTQTATVGDGLKNRLGICNTLQGLGMA